MLQFHGWKKTGLLSAVWLRAQVHKTVATHSPRRLVCLRLRPDTKTNPPQWEEGAGAGAYFVVSIYYYCDGQLDR
ncbi:hypothetical protein V1522DRAFT_411034 [Lipomyces starkeyi]